MNHKLLQSFKFWDKIDTVMGKERYSGERRTSLYPSEASTVIIDPKTKKAKIIGGCNRKSWYRLMKFEQSEPITVKTEYTFAFGNMIENFIKDLAKEAGIYNNGSVKFFDRSSGVSGEIDLVCEIPVDKNKKGYIHTEIKSTWGGQMSNGFEVGVAKSLFDHPEGRGKNKEMVKARPRESNVLQLILYLFTHKDDEDLIGGKLIYLLRDNFNRTEFDVTIEQQPNGKHRAMINGEIEESFYVEDIYDRFKRLAEKVNEDIKLLKEGTSKEDLVPPERDYMIEYDDATAKDRFEDGSITKTKYDNHLKGKKTGDWNCSYCSFKSRCWELGKYAKRSKDRAA